MTAGSYIFFGIFVIPLLIFLGWIMRRDKKKGIYGLILLVVVAAAAIIVATKVDTEFLKNTTLK